MNTIFLAVSIFWLIIGGLSIPLMILTPAYPQDPSAHFFFWFALVSLSTLPVCMQLSDYRYKMIYLFLPLGMILFMMWSQG